MTRLTLPILTGGLVDADSSRSETLEDNQLQKSDNFEVIGDGSRLTVRKDQKEYGDHVSGDSLNTVLAALFSTSIITISEPYYLAKKPTGMTGDFIVLVFGNDGGTYKLYRAWETSTTFSASQITITGVSYTSSSDIKFFVGEDRIIITDYINKAHYYRIDKEGDELSGVMGIPAPLNPASFSQLTSFSDTDFETNAGNTKLSSPGLVQVVYVAVTERGEMSNPSPISNTLRIQRFNLNAVGADEKWIDKVLISNLSIPVTGSGSDIESKLKWFDIYIRVMRYSEDAPENFEFSERVLIIDKSNTSGDTGNDYTLTIPVTLGQNPNTENDVAPVAKLAAQVGGVTALAGIKTKITFPFDFARYKKIIIQNKDGRSYVDAVVKLRLFDEDHSDGNKIADLNWSDYDTNGDDDIEPVNRNKIRFYDDDLTTALNVVYTLDTSADWCDVYIKIPLLIPGSHVIYLCFGDGSELASMVGVNDTDMQLITAGQWHHAGVTSWSGQTVFQSEMVRNSSSVICAPFDFQDDSERIPNLVNEDEDMDMIANVSFSITPIAAIPDLGDTFTVGTGSLNLDSIAGYGHFAGVGVITAQANGGSGLVRHTSAGHSLKVGDIVEMSGTTSYNGIFEVQSVIVDNFDLEQTWVANDAAGQFLRGNKTMSDRGYYYYRIAYAGSDVTADVILSGIIKDTNFLLYIESTGWFWKIFANSSFTSFTKISSPANTSGTGKYFVLLSWDKTAGTTSLFIYDMTNGTLDFEELSVTINPDQVSNFFLGTPTTGAINSANYSQLQYVRGRYLDATVLADINTVRNIGNFRPAFEQMIGESLAANNVNDGEMDDEVVPASTVGTFWTTNADWTVNDGTAGKAHCASAGIAQLIQTTSNTTPGEKYLVKYTISGFAAGTVRITIGAVSGAVRSANGTYVEVLTALNATALNVTAQTGGFTGDIDDVSAYPLSYNNNVDYSTAVKVIELKEQGNLLKWSSVNGIAFPDLNFKFLREPIVAIIPSPSFLQFNYENTFVIFMRNFINRFVLDGDPSKLAARSDVLIEEKTNFGLQYADSLARAGEDLLWKSEAGIIHWSPQGLVLISEGVISIPEIDSGATMYGFYNPIRNQYLLHNTDIADAGEGDPSSGSSGNLNEEDGIGNFPDPDSGTPTYLCVIPLGYSHLNDKKPRTPLYVRNTTGTVIDLTKTGLDILRLSSETAVELNTYDIKVTDASGSPKVAISVNGGAFGADISVTANGSTYNNGIGGYGFDIVLNNGLTLNDICRVSIGIKISGHDTFLRNQAGNDSDSLDSGGSAEIFSVDTSITFIPLLKFPMPSTDMPLKNHIESIESASIIVYATVGVTNHALAWHAIRFVNHLWVAGRQDGSFQVGTSTYWHRQISSPRRISAPANDPQGTGWAGSIGCSTLGIDINTLPSVPPKAHSVSGAWLFFNDSTGALRQNILDWLANDLNNHGLRATPSGGSSAARFRSSINNQNPQSRWTPRLAFTY